jgi:hypothetical protein
MAKIVRLKESELVKLIQKTIVEQAKKNNLQDIEYRLRLPLWSLSNTKKNASLFR